MSAARTLNPSQVHTLTEAVNGLRHPHPLLFALMLHAGLRIGEARQLLWNDLMHGDQPLTTLRIRREIAKGHRQREVPLPPEALKPIQYAYDHVYRLNPFSSRNYVATRHTGDPPITARAIQRALKLTAWAAINAHVTPHVLRHTYATNLLNVSNLEIVRVALGHKSVSTTQRYTHPNSTDLAQAVARMHTTTPPPVRQPFPVPL